MDTLTKYPIKDTDSFDEDLFPSASGEIDGLQKSLRKIKGPQKIGIVISFLKDHDMEAELLDDNKQLTTMLNSGSLPTSHLESLFSSGKHNAKFLSGLERYIRAKLG